MRFSIVQRTMFLFCAASVVVLSGCASQKAWLYSVEQEASGQPVLNRSVAVPPFSDQRVNQNSNMWAMYMIPLMPFGWQSLEAPEGSQMHMMSGLWVWRPNEDLAKATAEELQASHIFKEVFFTNRRSEGDLILQGTVNSTFYSGKLFSYCLSVYGPLLWFVGFPAGHVHNELRVTFSLTEQNGGKEIWRKQYSEDDGRVSFLYYLRSDFNYSELYKVIMLHAMADMRRDLATLAKS